MTELDYVRANYCSNRDVATGNYDCPYATTVMNTICCTGHECNYKGIYEKPVVNNSDEEREKYFKLHSASVYGNTVHRIILGEDIRYLSDEAFPF